MTAVSPKESFRYGFYLYAYWLALLLFSAALVVAGAALVDAQEVWNGSPDTAEYVLTALGGFVAFLGVLTFGSGNVGFAHKLVADSVEAGSEIGSGDTTEMTAAEPAGDASDEPEPSEPAQPQQPATAGPADDGSEPAAAQRSRAEAVERTEPADPEQAATREPARDSAPRQRADPEPQAGQPGGSDAATEAGDGGESDTGRADATATADEPREESDAGAPADGPVADRTTEIETDDGVSEATDAPAATTDEPAHEPDSEPSDEPEAVIAGESPEDVASDSEIAEELGFGGPSETGRRGPVDEPATGEPASDDSLGEPAADEPNGVAPDARTDDPIGAGGGADDGPVGGEDETDEDPHGSPQTGPSGADPDPLAGAGGNGDPLAGPDTGGSEADEASADFLSDEGWETGEDLADESDEDPADRSI